MSIEQTKLKDHFPMIRDRQAILSDIMSSASMSATFNSWSMDRQSLFLDICSGARGVKMLYDSFFKEILNPEQTPNRLSSLLSELLGRKVTVKNVLPNDSERLADEMSLVITDIVVELEDRTIANVEIQKIGYAFPGERASCYSADLLLRQYKRVRDERKKSFSYKDLAPVYTIVFMENSPHIFYQFPDVYVHYISETSNTGIELNLLQNFIFIPVDIFISRPHNEIINNKLDAWLTFLGCDDPERIIQLITAYPEFKPMYSHLYDLCRNIEGVMDMFSKELTIMDRNTVRYMIDDLQEQLDATTEQLNSATEQLNSATEQLNNTTEQLNNTTEQLNSATEQLSNTTEQLINANTHIKSLNSENSSLTNENKSLADEVSRLQKLLSDNGIDPDKNN
ncbi:MAG: PD-(D/E)XK nuclease family transposase [Butyrivibrio sp.]|nr:PD-(D/E)XK nuclease family transposase [Butyrivibrio sp.]